MAKLNVAVLAGGRSSEHDISRLSAQSIIEALDPARYDAVPVLIERDGAWRLTTPERLALAGAPQAGGGTSAAGASGGNGDGAAGAAAGSGATTVATRESRPATVTDPSAAIRGVDVIFPVLHGPFGEDGTIQGLLETAGVAYVGAGVMASAIGMDKAIFKAVMRDAGIPVAAGEVAHRGRTDLDELVRTVAERHGFPVFVKPARLGSSVGISKASSESELRAAIELAYRHDSKVLVEAFIEGVEVECGVMGNDEPVVSLPGEVRIASDSDWYDFDTKYTEGKVELVVPADIPEAAAARVREVALEVFHAIDCEGLARVDCFVTPAGEVIVNEVNTMPGFTRMSAFAKLFAASGMSYNEVVDTLIQLAIDRHREKSQLLH